MDHWRAVRVAPGEDAGAWTNALSIVGWERRARVLKRDAGAEVLRVTLLGRDVVVKTRELRGLDALRARLGASRAFRHWRGAAWLIDHGFRTAAPRALLLGSRSGLPVEAFVADALAGKSVLHHLADEDLPVREEHAIAREIGGLVARLGSAGRYNADGKPSNLIVLPRADSPGRIEIAVIDCAAIRRRSPLAHVSAAVRMLADLAIEPIGVGVRPRRSLMMRVVDANVRWGVEHWLGRLGAASAVRDDPRVRHAMRAMRHTLWRRAARAVREHGDPRPLVHPLHG